MQNTDSDSTESEPTGSKKRKVDSEEFSHVEFLDLNNLSGTSSEDFCEDNFNNIEDQDRIILDESGCSTSQQKENDGSLLNISINVSASEFKSKQFHFIGVFYVRLFRSQHLMDMVCTKDVYGNSVSSLLNCIWGIAKEYVGREVVVEQHGNEQQIRWSLKETPDETDLDKYMMLKHGKTKKFYTMEDIRDNSKLLNHWRGKNIQVHVFKYSSSIATNAMWEKVNKQLLHPERKDKTGAPATEEVFDCVHRLKELHSHYTAHFSSWERWANFILAQPGDQRNRLMREAPPDEYLHLFRAAPVSEANQLKLTRQGLQVAYNINESVSTAVNNLCIQVDSMAKGINGIQRELHCLRAQVTSSRSLLDAMQDSLPPEETEFSRMLASLVTNMPDVDHTD